MFATPAGRFQAIAMAEAVSWAGLLAGMLIKYVLTGNQLGVHIFGTIHGVVFLAYLVLALLAKRALGWDTRTTTYALLASIPPFGSIVFQRWAARTGRLEGKTLAAAG